MVDLGLELLLARMTQPTVLDIPGYLTVMAGAAETVIEDIRHGNFISTRFKLKTKVGMTHLAGKSYAMEPMRENDRPDAGFGGIIIDYDIAILCIGFEMNRTGCDNNQ